jgi:hypothetical protein
MITDEQKRRYKLHKLAKKEGFKLVVRKRTFYVPHTTVFIKLPDSVSELRDKFGYVIQTEII